MNDIIFCSWGGQVVDNRGKDPGSFTPVASVALPAQFKENEDIKALIGWDGLILRKADVDVVHLCRTYLEAVHTTSSACGKCNYCATGYKEVLEVIADVFDGNATDEDLEFMKSAAEAVADSSKCSIGKKGPTPLFHALTHFPEQFKADFRKGALPAALTYHSKLSAPCMDACPIHLDIPKYIELIKDAKFGDSLNVIREALPLPGVLGRVCYHPCEQHCRRANVDQPIAIRLLKRFVADQEIEAGKQPEWAVNASAKTGKVAIVGAGPAGLTCAYHLARKGHQVTIFEKHTVNGGMLSLAIPEYRLPRAIVNGEIAAIAQLGVEIKTGVEVGKDVTTAALRDQGYQALFVSIGAQECKTLGIDGEQLEGVYAGVDFLRDVRLGKAGAIGQRVAVIGGGNVAIDAVRTALRLGGKQAMIVYRRSRQEMPAHHEEIEDCLAEGVQLYELTDPVRIVGENGRVKALECRKMTLGEPDASGRRRPVPVEGSQFVLEVDTVIPALGQESDWACLGPECACTLSDWGTMKVNPYTLQTEDAAVFSGGDAVLGPKSVVEAAAAGKKAALSIDRMINGQPLGPDNDDCFDDLFKLIKLYDPKEVIKVQELKDRLVVGKLAPEQRKASFAEVENGFSSPEAVAEAERCLRCYRVVTVGV
jgi:NADPH-dependent glutamate synthase beta subunit-like oxidoreductase